MDLQILSRFFMWCTLINAGLLILSFLFWFLAADLMFKLCGHWFQFPRESFSLLYLSLLGLFKLLIVIFNAVPWLVLEFIR